MSYFAKIDEANIVTSVIAIEQEELNSGLWGDPAQWIRTSYNTRGGVYYDPETNEPAADQTKAFRKNYAGVGFIFDAQRDAFVPPRPFLSWTLNEQSCLWDPPIPYPSDGKQYEWNEETQSWVVINEN